MPKFNMKIPHKLGQDEALKRIHVFLGKMKEQYADLICDVSEQWKENSCQFSFSVMRFSASGSMTVDPVELSISGSLPLVALPLKGKIESIIRERAEKLLV